ncbi:MAG: molybdopterin cofactor-binding domain-containing protein, partial [Komagataeibacter saccharivorans]|uniref:molybdopterin cofactor-binding domain-containing protein n=1 Tax=Komagataeibacter saccharivorans TaxID=265959 RepID=UPI0039E8B41A
MGRLNRFRLGRDGRREQTSLSRRGFLVTSLGAGVMFGFARPAAANQIFPLDKALPGDGAFEPTIWCSIAPDGEITVNIIRAEMGQHIGTALARIIADEMEADWSKVRINYVDTDPKWGLMVTGGSWSVWMTWDVFRQAGAATRTALVEEAARLLGTTPDKCTVANSIVSAGTRQISFGDIVAKGHPSHSFTPEEMAKLPLKPASAHKLIGNAELKALDIPSKTNGTAIYGIDAKMEGMVYARPKMPPTRYGSKVRSVDDSEARKIKGYVRYLLIDDPSEVVQGWVVGGGTTHNPPNRAAPALKVDRTPAATSQNKAPDIQDRGRALINNKEGGVYVFNDDGVDQAFSGAHAVMDQEYT